MWERGAETGERGRESDCAPHPDMVEPCMFVREMLW